MYIIKNLNDENFDDNQRAFIDFIKEKVDTTSVYERIANKDFQRKYSARQTEIYTHNNLSAYSRINRINQTL